jgi:hypothetical protein
MHAFYMHHTTEAKSKEFHVEFEPTIWNRYKMEFFWAIAPDFVR